MCTREIDCGTLMAAIWSVTRLRSSPRFLRLAITSKAFVNSCFKGNAPILRRKENSILKRLFIVLRGIILCLLGVHSEPRRPHLISFMSKICVGSASPFESQLF